MSFQWVNSGPGGPWDRQILLLPPGGPGFREPEPTKAIVYTGDPLAPYILKPASHSLADISQMVVRHTNLIEGDAVSLEQTEAYNLYKRSIPFDENPEIVLQNFFEIFNHFLFGGTVKNSVVADCAVDERKNIVKLEFVSDEARAVEVDLGGDLGLTTCVDSGCFRTTYIYIKDVRNGNDRKEYFKAMHEMLGTLAHEMIHAMEFMYIRDEELFDWAHHCTDWQKAAAAIEHATSGAPAGHDWFALKLNLGRLDSVLDDIVFMGNKEPTDLEILNMGFQVQGFKERLGSLQVRRLAHQWAVTNEELSYLWR